jgi:ABC-type multidrug transport system fused ATPase/permease subunit
MEAERQRAIAEVRRVAEEEGQRVAQLEAIRSQAEAEAQQRAEAEQRLNLGIEALRKEEADQLKRIEEAAAGLRQAKAETRRRAEVGDRLAEYEGQRLAHLETIRSQQAKADAIEEEAQRLTEEEAQIEFAVAAHLAEGAELRLEQGPIPEVVGGFSRLRSLASPLSLFIAANVVAAGALVIASGLAIQFLVLPFWLGGLMGLLVYLLAFFLDKLSDDDEESNW